MPLVEVPGPVAHGSKCTGTLTEEHLHANVQIWPEKLVPYRQVGRLTLNANTANAFNENAELAFAPAHLVPGIDVSADRLLQLRCAHAAASLFDSYTRGFSSACMHACQLNEQSLVRV